MKGLEDRCFVVTGAASGIGWACASRLVEEGSRVIGGDLIALPAGPSDDSGWPVAEEGPRSIWSTSATIDSVAEFVDAAVAFGGRIDGVVHAAGVAGGGPVHLLPDAEWERVLRVNLTGTYLVAKHVDRNRCSIIRRSTVRRVAVVTVASIEGLEGTAGGSAYSASKGGTVLLTRSMAIDYAGRGIRVNAVCPGSSTRR